MTRFTLYIPFLLFIAAFPAIAGHVAKRGDGHSGGHRGDGHGRHHRHHHDHTCTPSPTPSTPSNCFSCPPQDSAGFNLGDNSNSNNSLFCSYPVTPGEDPHDFFCTYDATTGVQTEDHDAGLCPATAVSGSCTNVRRRENIVQTMKRKAEARAAQPQTSRPDFMAARSALGKKRAH